MLGILIFSWIVSVLLVLLAERNNGYSSSLSHDEKNKKNERKKTQIRTRNGCQGCKAKRRTPYMDGAYGFLKKRRHRRKQKRQHRENTIIMYFPGFYINATFGSQTKSSIYLWQQLKLSRLF